VTAAGEKGTEVSADPAGANDCYSHDFSRLRAIVKLILAEVLVCTSGLIVREGS
jgi:hypothetical protein